MDNSKLIGCLLGVRDRTCHNASNFFLKMKINKETNIRLLRLSHRQLPKLTVGNSSSSCMDKCDALRDLVPFVQFKKRENTHGVVLLLVSGFSLQSAKRNAPPCVLSRFLKLYKGYPIAQCISYIHWPI